MSKPNYTMRELRQELEAERITKNILRDTYEKLEQELVDTKKRLEEERHHFQVLRDDYFSMKESLVMKDHEIEAIEAFKKESDDKLREALDVIGFYGDVENWDESDICHTDVNNDRTIDYEGQKDRTGGKRARSFLKRCEQGELLQKHTTKMEG